MRLKPKSSKCSTTYSSLPKKTELARERNKPSKITSSLYAVKRIFFHKKKLPQKSARTRNTPNVYTFINGNPIKTGSIMPNHTTFNSASKACLCGFRNSFICNLCRKSKALV